MVFSCWYSGKLAVHPYRNLICNIGFSKDATHTRDVKSIFANRPLEEMHFPLVHPERVWRCSRTTSKRSVVRSASQSDTNCGMFERFCTGGQIRLHGVRARRPQIANNLGDGCFSNWRQARALCHVIHQSLAPGKVQKIGISKKLGDNRTHGSISACELGPR